jgi:hypothetical protein
MQIRLTRSQVLQIASRASCDPRTVDRVLSGAGGTVYSKEAVMRAAVELGFLKQESLPGIDVSWHPGRAT